MSAILATRSLPVVKNRGIDDRPKSTKRKLADLLYMKFPNIASPARPDIDQMCSGLTLMGSPLMQ